MVLSEVKSAFSELERLAHGDMTDAQTTIWGEDPGHIVLMHSRYLQCVMHLPKAEWPWGNLRESWEAILERRHLPYVGDWLVHHELRIGLYLAQNGPIAGDLTTTVRDRLGVAHTLQRA